MAGDVTQQLSSSGCLQSTFILLVLVVFYVFKFVVACLDIGYDGIVSRKTRLL